MKVTSIKTVPQTFRFVFMSCVLCLSLLAEAQKITPKLNEIAEIKPELKLELTQELTSELSPVKGSFFQSKNIKPLKRPFKSEGSFIYLPNKGLLWQTKKPIRSLKLFANNGVYKIDEQGKKHKEAQLDNDFFLALFAADEEKLARFFTTKKLEKKPETNLTCLALTPISSTMKSLFESINLCTTELIDGTKLPKKIALIEPKGNHTEINFELSTEPVSATELAYFE